MEYITIYHDSYLNLSSNYMTEKTILLDKDIYLRDIAATINETDKQFDIDVRRSELYINGYRIERPEIARAYLCGRVSHDIAQKTMMLCTQACMARPFEILHGYYQSKGLYIGEVSTYSPCIIKLEVNDNEVIYSLKKQLRIFSIVEGDGLTLGTITVKMRLNIVGDEFLYFIFRNG